MPCGDNNRREEEYISRHELDQRKSQRERFLTEYLYTQEYFLCRACRLLTKDQMKNIVSEEPRTFDFTNELLVWYLEHLKDDLSRYDNPDHEIHKKSKAELERLEVLADDEAKKI